MTKFLNLIAILAFILVTYCIVDEYRINDQNVAALDLSATLFQNSSIGMYKGVFTTRDGLQRGVVEIGIPNVETSTIGFWSQPISQGYSSTLFVGRIAKSVLSGI